MARSPQPAASYILGARSKQCKACLPRPSAIMYCFIDRVRIHTAINAMRVTNAGIPHQTDTTHAFPPGFRSTSLMLLRPHLPPDCHPPVHTKRQQINAAHPRTPRVARGKHRHLCRFGGIELARPPSKRGCFLNLQSSPVGERASHVAGRAVRLIYLTSMPGGHRTARSNGRVANR
jgi:hypothetical protein